MKKEKILLIVFYAFLALAICFIAASCEQEAQPDDTQKTVGIDHHGSVDVKISQWHLGDTTYVKTEKSFYDARAQLIKVSTYFDTVKSLGMITDTLDTGITIEDADGNESEIDTLITHPKNYQFYISIK